MEVFTIRKIDESKIKWNCQICQIIIKIHTLQIVSGTHMLMGWIRAVVSNLWNLKNKLTIKWINQSRDLLKITLEEHMDTRQ